MKVAQWKLDLARSSTWSRSKNDEPGCADIESTCEGTPEAGYEALTSRSVLAVYVDALMCALIVSAWGGVRKLARLSLIPLFSRHLPTDGRRRGGHPDQSSGE
jgi:hypothetical protein